MLHWGKSSEIACTKKTTNTYFSRYSFDYLMHKIALGHLLWINQCSHRPKSFALLTPYKPVSIFLAFIIAFITDTHIIYTHTHTYTKHCIADSRFNEICKQHTKWAHARNLNLITCHFLYWPLLTVLVHNSLTWALPLFLPHFFWSLSGDTCCKDSTLLAKLSHVRNY